MNPGSGWFGLKTWFGLVSIYSDWCIGLDTNIGMNRNSSDWLGMNFNPILSPGMQNVFRIRSEWNCFIRIQIAEWFEKCWIGSEWLWFAFLAKVLDWNSSRSNQNYSYSFRYPSFQSISIGLRLIQTEFSIRINPNHSDLGFIRIDSDWNLGFGLILIDVSELIGSSWIDFWPFFHQTSYKTFFWLVRNDLHLLGYRYRNKSE